MIQLNDKLMKQLNIIQGGLCNVYLPEEKRTVTIPSVHLEPSLPVKQDKVINSFFLYNS